jgi:hypothetical protein
MKHLRCPHMIANQREMKVTNLDAKNAQKVS